MKNNAKLIIEKLDANILVVGKIGSGKSNFIKGLNIPDSYYFDFTSIRESKSWDYPVSLTDRNFKDFNFKNLKEKTIILDAVEFSDYVDNSPLINFIRNAAGKGKRIIAVAFPGNAKKVHSVFDAVIEMKKESGHFYNEVL